MWTYLLGPFLVALPLRWRRVLPFSSAVHWRPASILSGLAESIIAITALTYWYWYSMSTWISAELDRALAGKTAVGTTDHNIATAALLIWATSPVTWGIAFAGIEGMVRVCAAFTDTFLGIFPLFLVDKFFSFFFWRSRSQGVQTGFSQSNVSSYVGAIRDKLATTHSSNLPDEVCVMRNTSEEFLEIRSCRAKPEWNPPRVVRVEERYYRLEDCVRGASARPFVYRLRPLSKGVPGRSVLIYAPAEEPVKACR